MEKGGVEDPKLLCILLNIDKLLSWCVFGGGGALSMYFFCIHSCMYVCFDLC